MLNPLCFALAAFATVLGVMLAASRLFTAREFSITADGSAATLLPAAEAQKLIVSSGGSSSSSSSNSHRSGSNGGSSGDHLAHHAVLSPRANRSETRKLTAVSPHHSSRRIKQHDEAASPTVEICFLALGAVEQMDRSASIIRNIEAHNRVAGSVRYHLLIDKPPALMRARMKLWRTWRGVPKQLVWFHGVDSAPSVARALYKQLSRTATGPGPIYLYKPLLHLVLPRWISRLIVLDTDLFLTSDIAGLWAEFDRFAPRALLGLAAEQCPSYQQVRALGGVGLNGGVQLLHLARMRRSARYAELIDGYIAKPMRYPMKEGGIGWLGDQTLYSWMSVNGTGGNHIFHILPCGWNRQIGTHMAGWPHFWRTHECNAPCNLIHGNYVSAKWQNAASAAQTLWTSRGAPFHAHALSAPLCR